MRGRSVPFFRGFWAPAAASRLDGRGGTVARKRNRVVATVVGLLLCGQAISAAAQVLTGPPGFQPPLPTDGKQLRDQLMSYDQVAVAAARHYYQSASVKRDMMTMVQALTPSIVASIEKQKGKALQPDEREKIVAATTKAAQTHMELLVGLNMVAALQTMTREELLALDQFYTSPIGQSILAKMPQLNQRLPGIFDAFIPRYSETVEAEIKATGITAN